MKLNWGEVWDEWDTWLIREQEKRTKNCACCGETSGGVVLWEEQQKKLMQLIDKKLRTK